MVKTLGERVAKNKHKFPLEKKLWNVRFRMGYVGMGLVRFAGLNFERSDKLGLFYLLFPHSTYVCYEESRQSIEVSRKTIQKVRV